MSFDLDPRAWVRFSAGNVLKCLLKGATIVVQDNEQITTDFEMSMSFLGEYTGQMELPGFSTKKWGVLGNFFRQIFSGWQVVL